ncbi:hypothetical protein CVU37_12840 [candidate division BRC1 bacterium HGW-BRC1-1]|jgi:hypothetical protein|nr:MAG: hypothetical protein CVU37_12840 [candidate division BRC1 bacterium HGW-BRC1-1]
MTYKEANLAITQELSEVIQLHNQAHAKLEKYRKAYPYLMAPNLAAMMEDNLKDNLQVLYKELSNLHRSGEAKDRHVCAICNRVFAARLPGGACDECKARFSTPRPTYGLAFPNDPDAVNPAVLTEEANQPPYEEDEETPEISEISVEPGNALPADENPLPLAESDEPVSDAFAAWEASVVSNKKRPPVDEPIGEPEPLVNAEEEVQATAGDDLKEERRLTDDAPPPRPDVAS